MATMAAEKMGARDPGPRRAGGASTDGDSMDGDSMDGASKRRCVEASASRTFGASKRRRRPVTARGWRQGGEGRSGRNA